MSRETDPSRGLNAAVAAVLNGERVAAEMTYDDLARATGISKRALLRYLSTKDRNIDVSVLATLAEAFRTTPDRILSSASERMRRPVVDDPEDAADAMRAALARRAKLVRSDDVLDQSHGNA